MITEEITQQRKFTGQPYEDDSRDSMTYKRELMKTLQKAEASIDQGNFITHEQLEKEYYSWSFK
ncbi:MAG: hypothetical protein ACOYK6_09040 [Chthoniobacterales bacterium]